MENFVNFLIEYKEILVSALGVLLTLIFVIIKRRPKSIDEFLSVLYEVAAILPDLINKVESPGLGEEKKIAVMSTARKLVQKKIGRPLSNDEISHCEVFIGSMIESILSTPQKKGVSD